MKQNKTIRRYTDEFKNEAVNLVLNQILKENNMNLLKNGVVTIRLKNCVP